MACLATFKKLEKMDFQYFFNIIPVPLACKKRLFSCYCFILLLSLSWFVLLKTLQVKTVVAPFSLHTSDEKITLQIYCVTKNPHIFMEMTAFHKSEGTY